jgi:hypothetical protein
MEERRHLKRRHLIYYLSVEDIDTGRALGHLVDVTPDGIMLMSQEPIQTEQVFRLRMTIPAGATGSRETIEFQARSVRSSKDVNPDFFDTGFHTVSLTPTQLGLIETLIDDYGFRD